MATRRQRKITRDTTVCHWCGRDAPSIKAKAGHIAREHAQVLYAPRPAQGDANSQPRRYGTLPELHRTG